MESQLASKMATTGSFSSVQKEYLQSFFSGLAVRGLVPFAGHTASGQITNDASAGAPNMAAEELYFNTPVSDLCREERWKYEQNPLDIWDKLIAHANEDKAPAQDDLFRFKFHGLFHVAPAQDSFMLRLRIPGSVLTDYQIRGLAKLAAEYGPGRVDLTTRGNLQIRSLQPKNIVCVLNAIQAIGMSSRGSGADNIRNITASPISGIDPAELYDVAPLAEAMGHYIFNSRDMYGLPRKFNIAFDNGGAISVLADTNDIGFVAVRVADGKSVPPGVYFRVLLCGITGHKQFASDSGLLLRPDQTVAVAAAMVRVFSEHGDRTDRKKARLKYLVDRWGVDKFIAETERRLAAGRGEHREEYRSIAPGTSESTHRHNRAFTTSVSLYPWVTFRLNRCWLSPQSLKGTGTAEFVSPSGRTWLSRTSQRHSLRTPKRKSLPLDSTSTRAQCSAVQWPAPGIRDVNMPRATPRRTLSHWPNHSMRHSRFTSP